MNIRPHIRSHKSYLIFWLSYDSFDSLSFTIIKAKGATIIFPNLQKGQLFIFKTFVNPKIKAFMLNYTKCFDENKRELVNSFHQAGKDCKSWILENIVTENFTPFSVFIVDFEQVNISRKNNVQECCSSVLIKVYEQVLQYKH